MLAINVTELRQHLPAYLKQVQEGQEIAITVHGKPVARLVGGGGPSEREAAQARLDALRGRMIVGDVVSPIGENWTADEDHL